VELQPELAEIAGENVVENGLSDRIRIHTIDMKQLTPTLTSGPVDRVVSNPPFYPVEKGRLNPDLQRAVARHEVNVTLSELISTAARMLRDGGRFSAVYPVDRLTDMLLEMRREGLTPGMLRFVHPKEKGPAKFFLVEGVKGEEAALNVPSPLFICQSSGDYTEEAAAMFLL
jgi:tRNA1Val (adenine37-N6)-methyltransferase